MQAINPINTHTKFGKDRINTFTSNEQKPSIRTADGRKSKKWGGGHNKSLQNKMTDCDKINEYDHCNSTISSVTILLLLSIFLLDVDRLGSIK